MILLDTIPTLESDRLRLRLLKLEDAPALFDYFDKEEVLQYYDLAPFQRIEEAEQLIQIWNKRTTDKQGIRWAITSKDNDLLIGTIGFHNLSIENNRAEIGYDLHPNYWNKGYITEVISTILAFGFNTLKLHRIEAFIDPAHHASRKVLHKNGMQTEGVLRDYFFEKGRFVDAEMLSIINR
ncbi:MAG: GNAT family N-acetyltransferase [Flavobacteriaceae bacterium]|jgi:ribosomal-protein-alanine N-acetyltransferase|nr:GNAT family N-acetyltransferase [Flavobacteriaceae bacterium]